MTPKPLIALIALSFATTESFSQQFTGGLHNGPVTRIYQPADIVNAGSKITINLISASGGLWNNAYELDKKYLLSNTQHAGVEGVDFFKNRKNIPKSALAHADIIGPAFTYNFKNRHFAGIYLRSREIVRLNNLDNNIFQVFNNLDNRFFNQNFDQKNLHLDIHAFNEIGFSYGRNLYQNNNSTIYAGATIKYLSGISAASIHVNDLSLNLTGLDHIKHLKGSVKVARANNTTSLDKAIVTDPAQFLNYGGQASVGADIGIGFRYHEPTSGRHIKASLAVTDIGSIRYKAADNSTAVTFNAESTGVEDVNKKANESLDAYITRMEEKGVITSSQKISDLKMKLPTALRADVDYAITPGLYVNAGLLLDLSSRNTAKIGADYINTFTVTPRFEKKWYGIGVPVTMNSGIQNLGMGLTVHVGPLRFGSSSLVSNLVSKRLDHADFYAGLSWPF